jgi:hypothetical protein
VCEIAGSYGNVNKHLPGCGDGVAGFSKTSVHLPQNTDVFNPPEFQIAVPLHIKGTVLENSKLLERLSVLSNVRETFSFTKL